MSDNKKDKDFRKLSIDTFFNFEADGIDIAQNQVKLIHNSGDIPSSGSQLEVAIRNFFKRKLPVKYYISNGHIIDTTLSTSPQLDLIIADNFRTPILYKTFDDTEYLTYESIYSYAEIKSSWNKKYIDDFVTTKERIYKFLVRENISPNFLDAGGKGIMLNVRTTSNEYKNPLFSFMFIGDSSAFSFEHIKQYYQNTNWKFLPNIICLYDKGLIVNINKSELENKIFKINLYPEFLSNDQGDNVWILLKIDKKRSTLGTLYYMVLEHLNTCVLGSPNMLEYMQKIFEINPDNIDFINEF
jgi:hypothetical protein